MLRGKDALCLLGLLTVGLVGIGCASDSPLRRARSERLARQQQPVTSGVPAVPPPPPPAPDAGKTPEVTQVSAQAPDPPPSSPAPGPGPSLIPEAPPLAPAVNAATSLRQLHRLAAERYAAID